MNPLSRLVNYINGSRQELKKVTWPSKKEVVQHTTMVIVVSLVIALFLGVVVDYSLTAIVSRILM